MSWGPLRLRTASHGVVFEGEASPAPGGGATPVTSPLDIAGCIFWLDASTLALADDAAVATWPDGSPNGYDATQADSAAQPVCKTAAQNGLRVVRFDTDGGNTPKWLALTGDALGLFNGLTAVTAAAVYARRLDQVGDVLAAFVDSDRLIRRFRFGFGATGPLDPAFEVSNDDTVDVDLAFLIDVSTSLSPEPNIPGEGSWPVAAVGAAVLTPTTQLTLEESSRTATGFNGGYNLPAGAIPDTDVDAIVIGGANAVGLDSRLDGDLAEFVVYDRALNATERRELLEYLSAKWATL